MAPPMRVGVLMLAALTAGASMSTHASAADSAEVYRSATGLRVTASAASLRAVLSELEPVAGISIDGLEHVAGDVTADFDLPVSAAILHLLRDYSLLLVEGDGDIAVRILGPTGTAGRSDPMPAALSVPPIKALWGEGNAERLARAVGGDAVAVLVEASLSPEIEARMTAVSGLAQYGTEAMGFLAAAAVHDPDLGVRLAAARSLAGAGQTASPHLVRLFREGADTDVRLTALSVLAATAGAIADDVVALASRDPDPAVRDRAKELSRTPASRRLPRAD